LLPIPLLNWMPGMGIATLAIALLQRDGLFAIASFVFFAFSVIAAPTMIVAGYAFVDSIIETTAGWVGAIF
jgi:hypothetical protein